MAPGLDVTGTALSRGGVVGGGCQRLKTAGLNVLPELLPVVPGATIKQVGLKLGCDCETVT